MGPLPRSARRIFKTYRLFSQQHGINIVAIIGKESNLWALCTSHTVGKNEKAGGGFAAPRLSDSSWNSLAPLNLCKVQPFWCIKTDAIILKPPDLRVFEHIVTI